MTSSAGSRPRRRRLLNLMPLVVVFLPVVLFYPPLLSVAFIAVSAPYFLIIKVGEGLRKCKDKLFRKHKRPKTSEKESEGEEL